MMMMNNVQSSNKSKLSGMKSFMRKNFMDKAHKSLFRQKNVYNSFKKNSFLQQMQQMGRQEYHVQRQKGSL